MGGDRSLHRVSPGTPVDLGAIDPADVSRGPGGRAATEAAFAALATELADLQARLWAGADRSVLVVLQGIDTAGKGGTVDHVFGQVHPVGLKVASFKAPSSTELAHDYLWRIHQQVPASGELGVFDRSHYEDVLAARVQGLVPVERWQRRFDHINAFEQMLVDEGTTIVKVFLHISKAEQRRRLQARLEDPTKRWKVRADDLDTRAHWDEYRIAFEEAIERTATEVAPWHVVPADKKWYRNWAVAAIVVGVLGDLELRWPGPEDLGGADLG